MWLSRRNSLKLIILFLVNTALSKKKSFGYYQHRCSKGDDCLIDLDDDSTRLGVNSDGNSEIIFSQGRGPDDNLNKVIDKLGGIGSFVGTEDIVIIKVNSQWWNQGTSNTSSLKSLVDVILLEPGFKGEVIIADNHQHNDPNSRAWNTSLRNGNYNLNELVEYFHSLGHHNVTKYHWSPATPASSPLSASPGAGVTNYSHIIDGPWKGDGYVYDDKSVYVSPSGRKCILTYPVFTSVYSGTVIDFKNGPWLNGEYIDKSIKLINFTGINYHSEYCGVTASVKNYMGIVDMSCGYPRGGPDGYYNVHNVGTRDIPDIYHAYLPWFIRRRLKNLVFNYRYENFKDTGGCLGSFMKKIRFADLNIIAAHWAGFGSRIDPDLAGYPDTVIAGTDPVALDLWSAREVLLPLAKSSPSGAKFVKFINPDEEGSVFRSFLKSCHEQGIGNMSSEKIIAIRA